MNEKIITFWKELSEENESIVKGFTLAALGNYVHAKLETINIPLAISGAAGYWEYKLLQIKILRCLNNDKETN